MSTQENVRNSQSATSILFERKANDSSISKPTKRQRKDPKNQVLVGNTETSSSFSQETLQVPANNFRCKEKIALKLNSLNEKKGKYESHKLFLLKCHRDIIIPHELSTCVEPSRSIF